jgi:4-alpha-glucanotransferase
MAKGIKSQPEGVALDRLADLFGIESEYSDARRKVQRTSPETKRALLQAMGVNAKDDSQISASLEEVQRAEWARALQPVYVVPADSGPIQVPVTLRAGTDGITWRLSLEQGDERSGSLAASELPLVARREVHGEIFERRQLALGRDLPWGYHRLSIDSGAGEAMVIVAPQRCWLPPALEEGRKIWGLAAQLYVLKSQENWGIGDFRDLRRLAESWAGEGADLVGVNPLHALFPDNPEHASPYSPSSRLLLNILYIDVTATPGFSECSEAREFVHSEEFKEQLLQCRAASLVKYSLVTKLKLQALRMLFKYWVAAADAPRTAFEEFRRERGEILERSCAFYCLRQTFAARDASLSDWRKWPEEYRNPASDAVERFIAEHEQEVTFTAWLQWLADTQLAAAAESAREMEIGLYRDMAVGADMCGVETWSNQEAVVSGAHIGAPPDIFNPAGQGWGLPPFHPRALKEQRYAGFIELIRANMRHAGALRIDHVMALQHLYWIPEWQSPKSGAYVRYPMEDLIGILALESQRNRCAVVGEDLGTVPDGFRERMAEANILSYRVLFFEQNMKTGVFRKPKDYPKLAVAVASNHDLPTIPAWRQGRDIDLRERLKLYPDPKEAEFQLELRERDREQLRRALEKVRLLGKSSEPSAGEWVQLVHQYLARSKSLVALIQLDDVTGEVDPVNLPGSTEQYPNWRRKLSVSVEELFETALVRQVVEIFNEERGSARCVIEDPAQYAR